MEAGKSIIIGTAGHVDHGKTALIERLTGVNTDRLAEEKRRGMTIDLGFAPFLLPNGIRAGIVDVPGHQKFLKNMLAGIGGIDLVLLVVAANEGVMPQTRAHLDILQLLEIPAGLVALTKIDLVDAELLELAAADVREVLTGTVLQDAPCLPVSSETGAGLEELVRALARLAEAVPPKDPTGPLRLPIDRAFLRPGFGSVVTGTLVRGRVVAGETVEILPRGLTARVRQVQVHNRGVEAAQAGQRCALNLAGVELEALERGEVIARPGSLKPTERLDIRLRLLSHAPPLKEGQRIRLYLGSAEVIGRIGFIARLEGQRAREERELPPGGEGLVQIRLEAPVAADFGDRVVLRLYSPLQTIGGGVVVNPLADKRRARTLGQVEAYNRADYAAVVEKVLQAADRPRPLAELETHIPAGEWPAAWEVLERQGRAIRLGQPPQAVHRRTLERRQAALLQALETHHRQYPWRAGAGAKELQQSARLDLGLLQFLLGRLRDEGTVEQSGDWWRLKEHRPRLTAEQEVTLERLQGQLRNGLALDRAEALAGSPAWAIDLLQGLVAQGEAIEVSPDILLSPASDRRVRECIRAFLAEHGSMSASQFRDLLGTTRKFAIPLLEYYDRQGVTRRTGDVRVLGVKAAG